MKKQVTLIALATPYSSVVAVSKEDMKAGITRLRLETPESEDFDLIKQVFYEDLLAEGVRGKSDRAIALIDKLETNTGDDVVSLGAIVWFEPMITWKPTAVDNFKRLFLSPDPGSDEAVEAELKTIKLQYSLKHNKIKDVPEDYVVQPTDVVQASILFADGAKAETVVLFEPGNNQPYMEALIGKVKGTTVEVEIPLNFKTGSDSPLRKATLQTTKILEVPKIPDYGALAKIMGMTSEEELRKNLKDVLIKRRSSGFASAFEQFILNSADLEQPAVAYLRVRAEKSLHHMLAIRKEADLLRSMELSSRDQLLDKLTQQASSKYIQQIGALYLAPHLGLSWPVAPERNSAYIPKYRYEYDYVLDTALGMIQSMVQASIPQSN